MREQEHRQLATTCTYARNSMGTCAVHCATTWNSGGVVVMVHVFNIVTAANVHSLLFSVQDIVSVHQFCVHTADV